MDQYSSTLVFTMEKKSVHKWTPTVETRVVPGVRSPHSNSSFLDADVNTAPENSGLQG